MSAVLMKKIQAGGGVPPSILNARAFWERLQDLVEKWVLEAFGIDEKATILDRQIIAGESARDRLSAPFSFIFDGDYSPALCAVRISKFAAIRYSARRLEQPEKAVSDTSDLFLKLLCEEAAIMLSRDINGLLAGHDVPANPPAGTAFSSFERFSDTQRYLQVEMAFEVDKQELIICMMMDVALVHHCAGADAQAGGEIDHHAQTILRDRALGSRIKLNVVLENMAMTIGDCSRFEIGQVLPLPGVDLGRLSLEVQMIHGTLEIGQGEIGVAKQQRAFKLNTPIEPDFMNDIASL